MSREKETAMRSKLWRPRFSIRTLAIFVTLVCVYFGAWEATNKFGLRDVVLHDNPDLPAHWFDNEYMCIAESEGFISSPMPFVVRFKDLRSEFRYCLWLFGPKIKLIGSDCQPPGSEWPAQYNYQTLADEAAR